MAFNVSASAWESDVNIANNTSVVHVRVNITSSGESHSYNNLYGTITIDGNNYSHGAYQVPYNANLIFESTRTITHNDDGAKSVNWSYGFQVKSNDTRTGSGSLTLTTIARASQPSCITWPNTTTNIGNVGDTITIHMNKKSTSFTHKVTYTLGSKSDVIATNVIDNCSWKIPLNLANYITNSKSGNGTIYAETFNGSTSIGKKSVGFTVKVPNTSDFIPTIDFGTNNNKITPIRQFNGKYLNKVSGMTISSNRSAKYGASVSSYTITAGGKSSSNNDLSINPINITMSSASQDVAINGTITDSRGYQGSGSTSVKVYRYNVPQITEYSIARCTSDGTLATNGTYAKVSLKYTYQNDGYSNSMRVHQIKFENFEPVEITTTETTSSGVVTGTGTKVVGGGNLAVNNHYSYTITCTDAVGKTTSVNGILQTASRIINVRPGGLGIAFGKFAEDDNLVDSEWNIKAPQFDGPLSGTATNATNVNVLSTTLASGTNYYPLFSTGTGNQRARANTSYKMPHLAGTMNIQRAMAQIRYKRQNLTISSAWTTVLLNSVESTMTLGSGLTIDSNKIKINNATIKKVKITASVVAFGRNEAGDTGYAIRRVSTNSDITNILYSSYNSSYKWHAGNSVTVLLDVSQNQTFAIGNWTNIATSCEHLGAWLLIEDVTEY